MSKDNGYPLTQPSEEFQAQLTKVLKLPHSSRLEQHLRQCATCKHGQVMCEDGRTFLQEVLIVDHWSTCDECHKTGVLCARGKEILDG
jgi:hypothetical protein